MGNMLVEWGGCPIIKAGGRLVNETGRSCVGTIGWLIS